MLKTRTIIVLIVACVLLVAIAFKALYFSKRPFSLGRQENLRRECEEILLKMTQVENCDQKLSLYEDNLKKCRDVYDTADKEDYNFRKDADGTFFDRILTNSLCYARSGDLEKAKKVLNRAEFEPEDMITMGAISCDPKSFFSAFISSLNSSFKTCLPSGHVKAEFLKALNESNFQKLKDLTKQGHPVSLDKAGEAHFECPIPLEDIQAQLSQISVGKKWTLTGQEDEVLIRKAYFSNEAHDKIMILIQVENDCEFLTDISALAGSSQSHSK